MKKTLRAYAKINITLDVTDKRPDGYHNLRSVMQTISLHDRITLEAVNGSDIFVTSNLPYLVTDKRNLAYRAAALFFEKAGIRSGLKINIYKKIPMGAGLGGGSADAAAVLIGLKKMFDRQFPSEELERLGLMCGADVPFCMKRGTYLAEGLGEILTPLTPLAHCYIVIAKPDTFISTKSVYESLRLKEIRCRPQTDSVIAALNEKNVRDVAVRAYNVLEYAVRDRYKELDVYKSIMRDCGAHGTSMSGSGSAVFGIFTNEANAKKAAERFSSLGLFSFVSTPVR